jgi:opacity protein-like surface antigen
MEKMKLLATLVCAIAVLAFAAPALAQDDEAEVDWDEAIEFAELTDTYVENGVEWETYYDELQNVMWSQPADATSMKYWDDLVDTVGGLYGNPSNKLTLFETKGYQAGVDH